MKRLITLLCAVSLVACGGSDAGTNPPPPPLPPITRLELADTSALVFTGSAVPGAAFVAHAYDATGAEVADPMLTLTAGSGWTIHGDTLIAPAGEARTTLRIRATRAEPTTADWVHFSGTGAADSTATDSIDVTAGINLRAYQWTTSYVCRFSGPGHTDNDGVQVDSLAVRGATVDSITYASEVAAPDSGQDSPAWRWFRVTGTFAAVYYSGTQMQWRIDGLTDTTAFHGASLSLYAQAPDTLFWGMAGLNNPATGTPAFPAPLVDTLPRRYVEAGGYITDVFCQSGNRTSHPDSLLLEAAS